MSSLVPEERVDCFFAAPVLPATLITHTNLVHYTLLLQVECLLSLKAPPPSPPPTPNPPSADERLHAAFHASASKGPRYQGWQGERVVQLDGSRGRVLLFSSADMQGRGRKVCWGGCVNGVCSAFLCWGFL